MAPTPLLASLLGKIATYEYIGMDFDPAADNRTVNLIASLTDVPLPAGSVDLAVVSHVLEHIPDDRKAMGEIARLLREDGIALVQVPQRPGPTDEDLSVTDPDERTRRYGQADHVRYYGDDFFDRLADAGLTVKVIRPRDFLTPHDIRMFGLIPDEIVCICTSATYSTQLDTGRMSELIPDSINAIVLKVLDLQVASAESAKSELTNCKDQLKVLEKQRNQAIKRRDRTARENQRLRSMIPVRLATGARKAVRRLTTRT